MKSPRDELRFARTLREADPVDRACAIETRAPRFDPERWLVGPALLLGFMALALLFALQVLD